MFDMFLTQGLLHLISWLIYIIGIKCWIVSNSPMVLTCGPVNSCVALIIHSSHISSFLQKQFHQRLVSSYDGQMESTVAIIVLHVNDVWIFINDSGSNIWSFIFYAVVQCSLTTGISRGCRHLKYKIQLILKRHKTLASKTQAFCHYSLFHIW